jgi:hypothetical protein
MFLSMLSRVDKILFHFQIKHVRALIFLNYKNLLFVNNKMFLLNLILKFLFFCEIFKINLARTW